ncbi:MAG TPA: DUF2946 family protein [Rhizomicrobium sp.]|nr:DUF2946 family protein [Rhizomicrobium sp.]
MRQVRTFAGRLRRQTAGFSLRGLITSLVLLAFAFQTYAVQTHIHVEPASVNAGTQLASVSAKAASTVASLDRDRQVPAPLDDAAHCPLCQEFLHAGAYLTPVPAALILPITIAVVAPLLSAPVTIIHTVSHAWRGRAPPSA